MAPEQVRILTVTDRANDYAFAFQKELFAQGFRAEVDDRNEKIGKKIREAQVEKVPYMLVIGDRAVPGGVHAVLRHLRRHVHPVQVCAKFIAVFIIFGAFLERTGISNFFIDLANSLVGSAAGGPAKVAVISSALCGMVSGSSVGNTVTTGSVTIPMMKKTGYKPEFAGAVEAASSTGGQIMPPIMGAAAFLMAEYMGVTYGQVTLWAILPAILYFTGIFIAVHLEAKKLGLEGIPRSQLPNFWKLQRYVYLLIPLVLLIWLVTANIRSLQFSASIAIISPSIVSLPAAIRKSRDGAIPAGSGGSTCS
jgi:TRAP transporter 4TM/12TM fusion protein